MHGVFVACSPVNEVVHERKGQGIALRGGIPQRPAQDVLRVPAVAIGGGGNPSIRFSAMHPAPAGGEDAPVPAPFATSVSGTTAAIGRHVSELDHHATRFRCGVSKRLYN